ncbi:hypothetical protein ACFVTM_13045 [Arthrobacter sp. NPDC058130]|uniref:hypothetical protein n=1 Tax=Arthrobacter sp. NPDC058130 TaxID=3346353 RepID=UPI0036E0211D
MMVDNRAAFERFVEIFYTQKRVREAFDFLVDGDYRQHNPTIPDGPEAHPCSKPHVLDHMF